MRKTISVEWLDEMGACDRALGMFKNQKVRDAKKILRLLAEQHKWTWAVWLLLCLMTQRESDKYFKIVVWCSPYRTRKSRVKAAYKLLGIKNVKW